MPVGGDQTADDALHAHARIELVGVDTNLERYLVDPDAPRKVLEVGGVSNAPNYKRQHRAGVLVMPGLFDLQQARSYRTVSFRAR